MPNPCTPGMNHYESHGQRVFQREQSYSTRNHFEWEHSKRLPTSYLAIASIILSVSVAPALFLFLLYLIW